MHRRDALKTAGGIVGTSIIGSVGLSAFAGSSAALTVDISSNKVSVSNDRGELHKVTIAPDFDVKWENFDDAVGKVFVLIEGKIGENGTYSPIYRATPWLTDGSAGTSGSLSWPSSTATLEVLNRLGRPDYENADYTNMGGVSASSYLDGTSMGSASQADTELDGQDTDGDGTSDVDLVNNFPSENAGYYGAADDASKLDVGTDGKTAAKDVYLRYTFELQAPNQNMVDYVINNDSNTTGLGTGALSGVRESDIQEDSQGNSLIVMNGEDGNYNFTTPAAITYSDLIANAGSHAGVVSTETSFSVEVTNEEDSSGATGSSNTGGS